MDLGEPFRVGERIGGCYQLVRLLGRGGMSYVFEAEDVALSRKVAIKVADQRELGSMLVLEARALAAVRHAGLPVIHGLSVHRGWTYLVLERLHGVTLEDHLTTAKGPRAMAVAEALPVLTSIADILATVHGAGMAHRDLKPGNVMLAPGDRTVLLDFGIVLPEVDAVEMPRCGTPQYVAPEAIRGAIIPGRAHLMDIYSYGAMAFEMLAGRPAFDGETTEAVLAQHLGEAPPDLAALRPEVPLTLSSLIQSCMAKDPWERPADMQAIVGELRGLGRRQARGTQPLPVAAVGRAARVTRETYRRPADSPPVIGDILIVEDDPDVSDALACVLNEHGYRTEIAVDGKDALERIRARASHPAMILLDLMMPVIDGEEFLQSQARDPGIGGIPVVVLTAQPIRDQPAQRARQFLAVRGVLPKPLALPTLLDLINDVCGEWGRGRTR